MAVCVNYFPPRIGFRIDADHFTLSYQSDLGRSIHRYVTFDPSDGEYQVPGRQPESLR